MHTSIGPDTRCTEHFLRLLYSGAPRGYLVISHRLGDGLLSDFFDVSVMSMDKIAQRTCHLAATTDTYFGVGLRAEELEDGKRGDANSVIVLPGFWADIDIQHPLAHVHQNRPPNDEAALEILSASGLEPGIIVRSGHGLHTYILFHNPLLIDSSNRDQVKRVAATLHAAYATAAKRRGWTIDNVSDLPRILRPAGTLNWKDPQNPKLVTFEYTGERYSVEDIEKHLSALSGDRGFVGFDRFVPQPEPASHPQEADPARPVDPGTAAVAPTDGMAGDFPPAKLEPILNGCAWMKHCQDDAETLPEPEWYAMLSVGGRCQDGDRVAHELSEPYPKYTFAETEKKLRHALEAAGPVTCTTVQKKLGGGPYCNTCPCRDLIKSPITLGTLEPDPVLDALLPVVGDGGELSVEAVDATPPSTDATTPTGAISTGPTATDNATGGSPPPAPLPPAPVAASAAEPWPKPKPLKTMPSVPDFDPDLLPGHFGEFALDVAERLQVPLDFPAAALLVALAGMVGRRANITPKQHDSGWNVTPNLWGGIVSRPGNLKTPTINEMFRPMRLLEKAAIEQNKIRAEAYERELDQWEYRKKKAYGKGGNGDFDEPKPERPPATRYQVNDATIEKLHQILVDNPQGVLLYRDELAGWFATLDTKGRERERPFFLEAWNGDGAYTIDRIGRGTLYVPHLCFSVFGGIQPSKLQSYLMDAVLGGGNDDGLVQRLQVLVWPNQNAGWRNVDRAPNKAAAGAVEAVFRQVTSMPVDRPFQARFSGDAQKLFNAWRDELEGRLRKDKLPAHLESHLAKYRSLMPSIAVLLHIAEGSRDPEIPLIQAQRAADWCDYLEKHAIRVYSCVTGYADRAAADLGEKIKAGKLGTRFTARDVYIRRWSGLATPDLAHAAIGELTEAGWIRPAPVLPGRQGGRPTEEYIVNPALGHE
jgi:putative DNA primase/helicase